MGRIVCGGLTWLKLQLKGVLRARDKVAKMRACISIKMEMIEDINT